MLKPAHHWCPGQALGQSDMGPETNFDIRNLFVCLYQPNNGVRARGQSDMGPEIKFDKAEAQGSSDTEFSCPPMVLGLLVA